MIYDRIDNIDTYKGVSERLYAGLKAIMEADFSRLEDGHYELDGENLFMNVMTVDLKENNDRPEAHRKYIDIQYVIEGSELIGVGNLNEMTEEVEANPSGDIWFYHGTTTRLMLCDKKFIVLFPQDAHAPCIAPADAKSVRKAVVKVLADE